MKLNNMPKKILFLLNNHFTHDSRVLKEGRSLTNAGYDVTIRCFHDDGLKKYEEVEGIHVERVLYTRRNSAKNLLYKIFLLISYFKNCLKDSKKFTYIHCHDLNTLPIGVVIKWMNLKGQKIIYDCHEYETEVYRPQIWVKPIFKVVERLFIHHADKYITVSESIAEEYKKKYGLKKVYLVLNCPLLVNYIHTDFFREKFDIRKDQMVFLYQGTFNTGRGIDILINVFKNLPDDEKVIVFMGYGDMQNEIQKAAKQSKNIYVHCAVKPKVLHEYTCSADVGICYIKNSCLNYYYCLPNKLFEYAMADLPVISSNLFELNKFFKKYKNGWIVSEDNFKAFKDLILSINKADLQTKKNNLEKIKLIYNWEEQEKNLLQLYKTI